MSSYFGRSLFSGRAVSDAVGHQPRKSRGRSLARWLGCTTATVTAVVGLVPVMSGVFTSSASAASNSCSATLAGTQLSRTGWAASASNVGDPVAQALDGNLTTRYSSGALQATGMWFQVNMGSAQSFDEIDMEVPNSAGDYARGYSVEVSNNGTTFTTVETCTGTSSSEVASFALQSAQYIRVVLTTSYTGAWWSIDEFYARNTGSTGTTTTSATSTSTSTSSTTTTTTSGSANCSASLSGSALGRTGWAATASNVGDPTAQAIDGNLTTRYSSGASQAVGMWFQVNMGSTQGFNEIDMQVPNSAGDYARGFTVGVSNNGSSFTTVATCTGSSSSEIVSFPAQSAQYVRVTLTTAYAPSWWSIDEFYVYGSGGGGTTTTSSSSTTTSSNSTTTSSSTTSTTIGNGANVVKVTGSAGNWSLTVNGASYYIKGMTWGPANSAAGTYMPSLKAMGVNTVRTWGTDSSTGPLLSAAPQYGIRVINGFWLNYGTDWINNTSYENSEQSTIVGFVNQYKSSPGTLMWDLGNEVLLNNANFFSGAQLANENAAYLQYVNNLAAAVKSADPNHPVTSTEAWRPPGQISGETNGIFALYQQYCPNLDLWAVNAYGTIPSVYPDWQAHGNSKPYIVTEAGPYGEWEAPTDPFGAPLQENDPQMVSGYQTAWADITAHPSVDLGATLFNYGTQNDLGGVWYNVIAGGWQRPVVWAISAMFGGTMGANQAPNFTAMSIPNDNAVAAGSQFTVNMTVSSPQNYPLTYQVMLSNRYAPVPDGCGPAWCSLSNSGLITATFTQVNSTTLSVTAPMWQGIWKVYVYALDGHSNVGIDNESFLVVPPAVSGTNISTGKAVTDSSEQAGTGEGCPCVGADAVAPVTAGQPIITRWGSAFSDPQWLDVNLGSVQTIGAVQLVWENAFATAYQIQVSNNNSTWTTVYSTTSGKGGVETIPLSGVSGQYVRFYGTGRATAYGYSLWRMNVFN